VAPQALRGESALEVPTAGATLERRRALFAQATAVIEREYASELTLDEVTERVASSRRQLQRAFAEVGGTTFRSYLREVRMARAADLLEAGALPVNRVAAAVGYRQPAQFAKAFRRQRGAPPSAVRAAPA
jgi:AraC family transcriptional regulator of adaptative response / methylphosphotriester-DNA alkyltransferase methyltransferase